MTLNRVAIPSPNYSSRGGSTVRLIVLHTSEGATTYTSLGSYFANPASQVSSHVGIDDTPGTVGEYVPRDNGKAWTAANANPYSTQAEICTPSGGYLWTTDQWNQHPNMLANIAAWVAEEAAHFGIPIVRLSAAQAQSGAAGCCQHVDLGSEGGGHVDCGNGFPMDAVLAMAGGSAPAPQPPVPSPQPPAGTAPAWPYGQADYLGQPSPDPHCHSEGSAVMTWQTQMALRTWAIDCDGLYGPQSEQVCRQFQSEKAGLDVDGLVGPATWSASWTEPVT